MNLIIVCGARPNFVKIAALARAFREYRRIRHCVVHTGQHYDANMSHLFFEELGIPKPQVNLQVGSGSHARQTADIMTRFEAVLSRLSPDAVLVVGDVNSTIACALVASKLGVPTIHVEAGLRSFDRTMPEEVNRLLTDAISDVLFVSEPSGEANLRREGIEGARVHFVGNVMIDTLLEHTRLAKGSGILGRIGVPSGGYGVMTLHRPANVDCRKTFAGICQALATIQAQLPVVFCMHPRTRRQADRLGLLSDLGDLPGLRLTPPLGYVDFLHLMTHAAVMFTDSGGIQEEATVLKVPCLTLRDNTERPITLTHGTNQLVGSDPADIVDYYERLDEIRSRPSTTPPLWDGQAAARTAAVIHERFC